MDVTACVHVSSSRNVYVLILYVCVCVSSGCCKYRSAAGQWARLTTLQYSSLAHTWSMARPRPKWSSLVWRARPPRLTLATLPGYGRCRLGLAARGAYFITPATNESFCSAGLKTVWKCPDRLMQTFTYVHALLSSPRVLLTTSSLDFLGRRVFVVIDFSAAETGGIALVSQDKHTCRGRKKKRKGKTERIDNPGQ